MNIFRLPIISRLIATGGFLFVGPAMADDTVLNSGDTAWMLTATALVLFMTIPGLALFYAGMVRAKNVLSVLMQCFAITALMTVLWSFYGYSIAFGGEGAFWGGFDKLFLRGVTVDAINVSDVENKRARALSCRAS